MKTPAVTRPIAEDLVIVVWTLRTMARDGLDVRLTYSDVEGWPPLSWTSSQNACGTKGEDDNVDGDGTDGSCFLSAIFSLLEPQWNLGSKSAITI